MLCNVLRLGLLTSVSEQLTVELCYKKRETAMLPFLKLLHFLNMLQQTLRIRSVELAARSQNHDDASRKFLQKSVFQMQLQSSVCCLCKIEALSQSAVMCL